MYHGIYCVGNVNKGFNDLIFNWNMTVTVTSSHDQTFNSDMNNTAIASSSDTENVKVYYDNVIVI